MASTTTPANPAQPGMAVLLTDDLLAEVLVRLPTLADLGRACVVCPSFRRVVTDPAFLRRVRALLPPPLLGILPYTGGFSPAEPPHGSAPAARALVRAADFSFSFLPSPSDGWAVLDARDGRVLLDRSNDGEGFVFTDLVVCDPLYRRYLLLPPIPEGIAASVQKPHSLDPQHRFEAFLAPHGEDEAEAAAAQTSFRVVWMAQCPTEIVAAVFSSVTGQWVGIGAPSWRDLIPATWSVTYSRVLFFRSYAYGCFYWMMVTSSNLLALDVDMMEFSVLKLPSGHRRSISFITEAGEGKLGMFALRGYGKLNLFSTSRRKDGEDANEWKLENKVVLDSSYRYNLLGAANGILVLQDTLYVDDDFLQPKLGYISLEFSNMEHERICRITDKEGLVAFMYISYPPSLSSPSI